MPKWLDGLVKAACGVSLARLADASRNPLAYKEVYLAICGGIGAGKSTLLKLLARLDKELEKHTGGEPPFRVLVQPEPTEEFGSELKRFYDLSAAQVRDGMFAFWFQCVVCAHQKACAARAETWCRTQRERGFKGGLLVVQERCCLDATAVFMELAVRNGLASEKQAQVLHALVGHGWRPDGLVFVRASADVCVAREVTRARVQEKNMNEAYVRQVATRYDEVFSVAACEDERKSSVASSGPFQDVFTDTGSPTEWASKVPVCTVTNESHWSESSSFVVLQRIMRFVSQACVPPPAQVGRMDPATSLVLPQRSAC